MKQKKKISALQVHDAPESVTYLTQNQYIHLGLRHQPKPQLAQRRLWFQSAAGHAHTTRTSGRSECIQKTILSAPRTLGPAFLTQSHQPRICLDRNFPLESQSSRGQLCTNRRICQSLVPDWLLLVEEEWWWWKQQQEQLGRFCWPGRC